MITMTPLKIHFPYSPLLTLPTSHHGQGIKSNPRENFKLG